MRRYMLVSTDILNMEHVLHIIRKEVEAGKKPIEQINYMLDELKRLKQDREILSGQEERSI